MIQLEWIEVTFLLLFFLAGMIFNYKAGRDAGIAYGIDSALTFLENQKIIIIDHNTGDFRPYIEEGEK